MNCQNHNDRIALYRCTQCLGNFCEGCIIVKQIDAVFTAYICKVCGQKVEPIVKAFRKSFPKYRSEKHQGKRKDIVEQQVSLSSHQNKLSIQRYRFPESLLNSFVDVFLFPFRHWGIFLIIIFALLFWGCDWFIKRISLGGWFSVILVTTYFLVFLFQIAEDSSHGSYAIERVPGWHYWLEFSKPAICLISATLLCLLPMNMYFFITQNFDFIFFIFVGLGIFLFPMFFIRIVLLRNGRACFPSEVIKSVRRTSFSYCLMFLAGGSLLLGLFFLSTEWLAYLGEGGAILSQIAKVYICFILVRLMGVFARKYGAMIGY